MGVTAHRTLWPVAMILLQSSTLGQPGLSSSEMEKESHLGKSRERTGGREGRGEGGRRVEILRLLSVSTASAAFICSGDRGRDGESLSKQRGALRDSRSRKEQWAAGLALVFLTGLPLPQAAVCVANVAVQVTFSFGKTEEFPGTHEVLAQLLSTAAPRYRRTDVAARVDRAEDRPPRLWVSKRVICICTHSSIPLPVHLSCCVYGR